MGPRSKIPDAPEVLLPTALSGTAATTGQKKNSYDGCHIESDHTKTTHRACDGAIHSLHNDFKNR
jgi:hypothetical protein